MFEYKEINSPVFKYSAFAVGTVCIIAIVWFFIALSNALDIGKGGSDYSDIQFITSPSKNYVATSFIKSGGGAAGWCYSVVEINKANEPSANNKEIFKGRCSNKLQIKWLDENHLKIDYSEETPVWSQTEWEEVNISYSLIGKQSIKRVINDPL